MLQINLSYFQEITREHAPHLFDEVSRLSEKAGIKAPSIHVLKDVSTLPKPVQVMYEYLAAMAGESNLLLGNKIRSLLGHHDLKQPVTEELSAVIAHELGHLKHNDIARSAKFASLSPWAGLAVGIAAFALVEAYQKNQKNKQPPTPEENLSPEALKHADEEAKKAKSPEQKLHSGLFRIAKYLAAATVGTIAGVFVMRAILHRAEFRADRFSAELLEDGKPLANALTKFKQLKDNLLKETGIEETALGKFFENILHPNIDKRIEKLQNWSRGK
jgi:Zn-dependent protease with chaperone function